jgi:hypothetical protein
MTIMRSPRLAAAVFFAALPGAAFAQSVNSSGMTLPHFQFDALLTSNAPIITPTAATAQIAPQRQPAMAAPAAKVQPAADMTAAASQKP